jgi:hypothetical protein
MNAIGLLSLVSALMLSALQPHDASASPGKEWRFEVFLDDDPIGFHHFQLNTSGDGRELRGEARFTVKLLGFTVYDYSHENLELWQDGCLQHIEARTDDNGEDLFVRGSRNGEAMQLQSNSGNRDMPGCVMSFAYWNPAILAQQRLLNAQTGEYLDVEVQSLGEQTLQLQGRAVPALHYRLVTEENDIDLWYSTDRDWLALSSTTSGGRQLYYRRVTAAGGTGSDSGE